MVLTGVVSSLQSTVPLPVQALVSRSQSLLATRVHSAFADTAVFAAAALALAVVALWIVAAVLCKRKRPPPPGAYEHNRYERDGDAGAAPQYDVCIVGAGVVGASLATVLARQGVRVACVERDLTEPDRIVGELLQPSGVEKLKALGLYDAVCGIDAQSVPGYGIIYQRCGRPGQPPQPQEHIHLPYPNRPNGGADNRDARTGAPYADEQMAQMYTGRGLHNGRFLMRLRALARAEPNVTLIQGNVNKLLQRADGVVTGVVYRPTVAGAANSNPYPHLKQQHKGSANGNGYGNGHGADHKEAAAAAPAPADGAASSSQRVRAALTIVVDGCFSVFRAPIWSKGSTTRSKFLGLVLDDCRLTVPGCGNVILADPSPVLVYPISSTETRMLIDFPVGTVPDDDDALLRHLTAKVRPQLPPSVQPSFDRAVAGRKWQWMPNQSLCVERPNVPVGAMVLGDSFNMRHPLTGGGMTVGLTDVELVARLFKPISAVQPAGTTRWRDTAYVHGRVTAFYEQRLGRSAVINILADALYQVFLWQNTDLCEACYDYLGKGPACYEGPVSLLSGLSRSQALLVAHFYSVALFAVGRLCLRLRFVAAANMFRTACRIILPLLVQENNTAPVRALWFIARWAFWL